MRTLFAITSNLRPGKCIRFSARTPLDAKHQGAYCFGVPLAMIQVEPCLPAIIPSRSAFCDFTEPDDSIVI